MGKLLGILIVGGAAAMAVANFPDIMRYVKMRMM